MNTKSLWRQVTLLALMVVAAGVALYWSNRPVDETPNAPAGSRPVSVAVVAHAEVDTLLLVEIDLEPPATALAALEQAARGAGVPLATRTFDFGRLVVTIGDVTAGDAGDWTYTVNGEFMPVGADACFLSDGDRLEFAFGEAPRDSL